jgi:hypothetical protein
MEFEEPIMDRFSPPLCPICAPASNTKEMIGTKPDRIPETTAKKFELPLIGKRLKKPLPCRLIHEYVLLHQWLCSPA